MSFYCSESSKNLSSQPPAFHCKLSNIYKEISSYQCPTLALIEFSGLQILLGRYILYVSLLASSVDSVGLRIFQPYPASLKVLRFDFLTCIIEVVSLADFLLSLQQRHFQVRDIIALEFYLGGLQLLLVVSKNLPPLQGFVLVRGSLSFQDKLKQICSIWLALRTRIT